MRGDRCALSNHPYMMLRCSIHPIYSICNPLLPCLLHVWATISSNEVHIIYINKCLLGEEGMQPPSCQSHGMEALSWRPFYGSDNLYLYH